MHTWFAELRGDQPQMDHNEEPLGQVDGGWSGWKRNYEWCPELEGMVSQFEPQLSFKSVGNSQRCVRSAPAGGGCESDSLGHQDGYPEPREIVNISPSDWFSSSNMGVSTVNFHRKNNSGTMRLAWRMVVSHLFP